MKPALKLGLEATAKCFAAASLQGPRPSNQDRWHCQPALAILGDGMGGHANGDRAAQAAVTEMTSVLTIGLRGVSGKPGGIMALLPRAFELAEVKVCEASGDCGTTMAVLLLEQECWYAANVGDSRIFLLRPGFGVVRLSQDDTVAAELLSMEGQDWWEAAREHPDRHLLTRYLGSGTEGYAEPHLQTVEALPGDIGIVVTDGLWEFPEFESTLEKAIGLFSLDDAVHQILRRAEAELRDNATLILLTN